MPTPRSCPRFSPVPTRWLTETAAVIVALLGAAALPLPVRAQPEMVVAGFLSARSPHEAEAHSAAFLRALAEEAMCLGETSRYNTAGRKATTTGCDACD